MNAAAELTKTIEDHGGVSVTTVKGCIESEQYKGFEIRIYFNSAEWINAIDATNRFYSSIRWNASPLSGLSMDSGAKSISDLPEPKRIAKAIAAAKKAIDRHIEDEALRSTLASLVGAEFETISAAQRMPKIGDVASLYSRGTERFGIVTAVGSKKIEIAYVTRAGLEEEAKTNGRAKATITRKAQPIASVRVLAS